MVFTNGCFDIIHAGHVRYLSKAKKLGDVLVVGLNSDSSVKKIKDDGRPIVPQRERAEVLSALEFVDYVVIFNESTPYNLIKSVQPDVLVKGADWKGHEIVGADVVKAKGGRVARIKLVKGRSTTNIIKKILNTYG
ncbi:MAG: D-glycero-beta-D-manno-heptose 1-phosphate adenylyltransferase [Deltaproteobacteria bacterium]|nr:D-glycero-beta-D-manno-heptose 1-phosphate adenylyltransferase [Deltaproteobacteria bacterium]